MEKNFDILIVEWEDSRRSDPNWQWMEDFKPEKICECKTIGYFVHKTENAYYIAQSVTKDNQMAGVITIPIKSVIKKTVISDGEQYQKKNEIVEYQK